MMHYTNKIIKHPQQGQTGSNESKWVESIVKPIRRLADKREPKIKVIKLKKKLISSKFR